MMVDVSHIAVESSIFACCVWLVIFLFICIDESKRQ